MHPCGVGKAVSARAQALVVCVCVAGRGPLFGVFPQGHGACLSAVIEDVGNALRETRSEHGRLTVQSLNAIDKFPASACNRRTTHQQAMEFAWNARNGLMTPTRPTTGSDGMPRRSTLNLAHGVPACFLRAAARSSAHA